LRLLLPKSMAKDTIGREFWLIAGWKIGGLEFSNDPCMLLDA
jgi:hypothetical protein